jgi:hypothetical protein
MGHTSNPSVHSVAVVLIHGIGTFRAGSILKNSYKVIMRAFGSAGLGSTSEQIHWLPRDDTAEHGHVNYSTSSFTWKNHVIDLIEFHWSDVAGRIRLRRPIDAFIKLLDTLATFPLVGVARASRKAKLCANFIGTAHCFLVCWALLGIAIVSYERIKAVWLSSKPGVSHFLSLTPPHQEFASMPLGLALKFELLLFIAYLVTHLLYFRLNQSPSLRYGVIALSGVVVSGGLGILAIVAVRVSYLFVDAVLDEYSYMFSNIIAVHGDFDQEFIDQMKEFYNRTRVKLSDGLTRSAGFFGLLFLCLYCIAGLGNLLRDVVLYLAPDSQTDQWRPNQVEIRDRLAHLLQLLSEQKYGGIALVTHSMGTVIVLDVLCALGTEKRHHSNTLNIVLVTAGSPLRRFIHRFLPDRVPTMDELQNSLGRLSGIRLVRWFNVYRIFDYVGQSLSYSALPMEMLWQRKKASESALSDELLLPRYSASPFHGNYWKDRRFLRFLAEKVILPIIEGHPNAKSPTKTTAY